MAGVLPLSLFEQQNLAEITIGDYPASGSSSAGIRSWQTSGRKREALLVATEAQLTPISVRVAAGTLRGSAQIGLAVGTVINKFKMKKHIAVDIKDAQFAFSVQPQN